MLLTTTQHHAAARLASPTGPNSLSVRLETLLHQRFVADHPQDQGEVALSIADDAYQVAFYISLDNSMR